jgi:hypothetical protein
MLEKGFTFSPRQRRIKRLFGTVYAESKAVLKPSKSAMQMPKGINQRLERPLPLPTPDFIFRGWLLGQIVIRLPPCLLSPSIQRYRNLVYSVMQMLRLQVAVYLSGANVTEP